MADNPWPPNGDPRMISPAAAALPPLHGARAHAQTHPAEQKQRLPGIESLLSRPPSPPALMRQLPFVPISPRSRSLHSPYDSTSRSSYDNTPPPTSAGKRRREHASDYFSSSDRAVESMSSNKAMPSPKGLALYPTPPLSGTLVERNSFTGVPETHDRGNFQLYPSHHSDTDLSPLLRSHTPPPQPHQPRRQYAGSNAPSEHWDPSWQPSSRDNEASSRPNPTGHHPDAALIRQHSDMFKRGVNDVSPPRDEDYSLVLDFVRQINDRRESTGSIGTAGLTPATAPQHPPARRVLADTSHNRRGLSTLAPSTQKGTKRNASPDQNATASRHKRAKPTPQNAPGDSKSARAKSSKAAYSKDYRDYPDYAPKWELAIDPEKHSKTVKRWSGAVNLADDPLRELCEPAELEVCNTLSLDCAKYLCLKRQLFSKYVEMLRRRKTLSKSENWNKTAAQSATNVDVNKVSFVFTWYQDMGLFNENHFKKFIKNEEEERNDS